MPWWPDLLAFLIRFVVGVRAVSRTDYFCSTMLCNIECMTSAMFAHTYTSTINCSSQYGTAPAVLPVIFPLQNTTL